MDALFEWMRCLSGCGASVRTREEGCAVRDEKFLVGRGLARQETEVLDARHGGDVDGGRWE